MMRENSVPNKIAVGLLAVLDLRIVAAVFSGVLVSGRNLASCSLLKSDISPESTHFAILNSFTLSVTISILFWRINFLF